MGNPLPGIIVFFLCLIAWHGLRMHWFTFRLPTSLFPVDPTEWPGAFGLDVYHATVLHEWWRAVTALFLHADAGHLFSNSGFGLLFFWALNRRVGSGLGFAAALAAGFLGNVGNALYKPASVISLGFSTALFGVMGLLGGIGVYDAAVRRATVLAESRRLLVPAAAALAFVALLGGGGEERIDYAAHIFGFCAGFLLGFPIRWADARLRACDSKCGTRIAGIIGATAAACVILAWMLAVQSRLKP